MGIYEHMTDTSGMGTLLLLIVPMVGFAVAYNTYGKYLARKIFKIDPQAKVPSCEYNDGVDFVPTKKGIIFGHHFTSIAGTGPIVGPAIGIIWGWVPAILWVLLGSIFMGAVHDMGTLVVSMRNDGKSISEIAARYINARVRLIFFVVVFFTLLLVIAVFGVIIATVFSKFPSSVIPVWLQIPIAIGLGHAVYKKNASVPIATAAAVIGMYICIGIGAWVQANWPQACMLKPIGSMPGTGVWTIVLLIYAWIASTLPVTTLLQPRDYINAWQLFIMMGLLIAGIIAAAAGGMEIVAPAINKSVNNPGSDIPSMWPMMFVTIACGAISGFHSLVASGTSPKQVANEKDVQFIGYGSMLLEGMLAVLVIICVSAGIGIAYELTVNGSEQVLTGRAAWDGLYSSWKSTGGGALDAVVQGAANILSRIGLNTTIGVTLMGVFIASFAGTTLDTTVRIQRYVISELAGDLKIPFMSNRWTATTFAVLTAAALAFMAGPDGAGAKILWPLFGSVNQLLAALALLVVTMYLKTKGGKKFIYTAVPCVLILTVTCCAIITNEINYYNDQKWVLFSIGGGIFILSMWMVVETATVFVKGVKIKENVE